MDNQNVNKTPGTAIDYQKLFRMVAIGIVAVLLLAIVISIVVALVPNKFGTPGSHSVTWANNDDGELAFVFNGSKKAVVLGEKGARVIDVSYDYKYCAAKTTSNELYIVNSKKAESVADDVSDVEVAAFANKFAYISDGDLYYGDLSNPKKAKKIDEKVNSISAISPDGSAFAYKVEDGDSNETYVCKNGKKGEKFDKEEATVFAISNKAKYVYYKETNDGETSSYVMKGKDKSKLSDNSVIDFKLNRDGSQIIFSSRDSKNNEVTYFVNKAGDKVRIEEGENIDVIVPNSSKNISRDQSDFVNVSSFAKCAVKIDSSYYLIKNAKGDKEKISELNKAYYVTMLDDGKTVLFIKGDSLRSCDITKPSKNAKEYDLGEDILRFCSTGDGKHIYVIDEDGDLCYVNSKKKMTKVDEDVRDFCVMNDGKVYYINEDVDLCTANKKASNKKNVEGAGDATDIRYFVEAKDLFVIADEKFMKVSGKKATKIFDSNGSGYSIDIEDYYDDYADYEDFYEDIYNEYYN